MTRGYSVSLTYMEVRQCQESTHRLNSISDVHSSAHASRNRTLASGHEVHPEQQPQPVLVTVFVNCIFLRVATVVLASLVCSSHTRTVSCRRNVAYQYSNAEPSSREFVGLSRVSRGGAAAARRRRCREYMCISVRIPTTSAAARAVVLVPESITAHHKHGTRN